MTSKERKLFLLNKKKAKQKAKEAWKASEEKKNMKISVTGSKRLDDGIHQGIITRLEERKEPYEYVDVIIELEGIEVKASYPATINPISNLGKLLERFGIIELKIGQELEIDKLLIGKKVQFQTMIESRDGMDFSKVIANSVKPIKE
jgi:hypothetical protein